MVSVAPTDGALLWEHAWDGGAIVQRALTAEGDILINSAAPTGGLGIRRVNVKRGSGGWTVTERWTSNGLKPYFSDFVVHNGHAYPVLVGNILLVRNGEEMAAFRLTTK